MAGVTLVLELLYEWRDECLAADGFWNWRVGLILDKKNSFFRFKLWALSYGFFLCNTSSVCLLIANHFGQVNHRCVGQIVDQVKDFFAVGVCNWVCSDRRCLGSSWFRMVAFFLEVLRVVLWSSLFAQWLQVFLGETTLVRGNFFLDVFIETVFMLIYTSVDQLSYS